MKIAFDGSGFTKEQALVAQLPRRVRLVAWQHVRAVSFDVERGIKLLMPVDTGRARASWGHSGPPAEADEGIWIEDEGALALTQGSRVEYIDELNQGHSTQAPAGFIDAEQARGEAMLGRLLEADVARALE